MSDIIQLIEPTDPDGLAKAKQAYKDNPCEFHKEQLELFEMPDYRNNTDKEN